MEVLIKGLITAIDSNLGWPIIVFYSVVGILLWIHYKPKFGLWLGMAYAGAVVSANSCIWEFPMFIRRLQFNFDFWVGFATLIPLIYAVWEFKIKIKPTAYWPAAVALWAVVEVIYLYIAPMTIGNFFIDVNIYNLGSCAYMSTFIPRSVSIVILWKLLEPTSYITPLRKK